jgi:hypothetical protein
VCERLLLKAFHVPEEAPYECRWPWKRRSLNTHDYRGTGPEVILADIQAILENALSKLNPPVERGSYYVSCTGDVRNSLEHKLSLSGVDPKFPATFYRAGNT